MQASQLSRKVGRPGAAGALQVQVAGPTLLKLKPKKIRGGFIFVILD